MTVSPLTKLVERDPYLALLRAVFAARDAVAAQTAIAGLDEATLLKRLANDKLDAALLDKLSDLPALLQPAALEKLRLRRQSYLALNIIKRAEAEELLAALSGSGISTVVLKGLDLAWRVYPDPGLRPYTDIDLLIAPEALDLAEAVLLESGYKPTPETQQMRAQRVEWMDYQYVHPASDVMFELHIQLLHPGRFALDHAAILARSEGGFLAPADRFLHLALHLAKHAYFDRLLWAYDLALLAGPELPQDQVAEQATAAGGRKAVWLALRLVRALFGVQLPELEAALAPSRFTGWILERALCRYARSRSPMAVRLLQLQLFDHWRPAARYSASRTWRKLSGSRAGW
jgi:hypothetical protein